MTESEYLAISADYRWFLDQAIQLKIGASAVHKEFLKSKNVLSGFDEIIDLGLLNSCLLLYALTIENAVKACVVKKMTENGHTFRSMEDIVDQWGKQAHDVSALARKYEIPLIDDDFALIERFKDYMIWAGRFPFPRNDAKILKSFKESFGSLYVEEPNIIKSFLERVGVILHEEIPDKLLSI